MPVTEQVNFDPDRFVTHFFSLVAKANRSVRDVFFLNTVFLWQRDRTENEKLTSFPDATDLIEHLKAIYNIQADRKHHLDKDCVTLERIHFAFPVISCKVAAAGIEHRISGSHLNRVMVILECPAFARFCPSLLALGHRDASLLVDAYCYGQYLHARRLQSDIEPNLVSIRSNALKWKSMFNPEDLAEILEKKLHMFKEISEMMLEEANVDLGVMEIRRTLRRIVRFPNVDFIVYRAIYEKSIDLEAQNCTEKTFLSNFEVLHYSGALLAYLTLIKKRLCRSNRVSSEIFAEMKHSPEMRSVLKEAAVAMLSVKPERIIQLMAIAGLNTSWGHLIDLAHSRVKPLLRNVLTVNGPLHITRLAVAEHGLEMLFSRSKLFRGTYPNMVKEWAMKWHTLHTVKH